MLFIVAVPILILRSEFATLLLLGGHSSNMDQIHAPNEHHRLFWTDVLCRILRVLVFTGCESSEQLPLYPKSISGQHLHPFAFYQWVARLEWIKSWIRFSSDVLLVFCWWLIAKVGKKGLFGNFLIIKDNVCRRRIVPDNLPWLEMREVGIDSSSVHEVNSVEMNLNISLLLQCPCRYLWEDRGSRALFWPQSCLQFSFRRLCWELPWKYGSSFVPLTPCNNRSCQNSLELVWVSQASPS